MNSENTNSKTVWKGFWEACYSGDYMPCYNLHRLIGFPFYVVAIRLGVRANYLTVLAFISRLVAVVLFLNANHFWRVAGVLFMHIGLGVDCIDGPVARYNKEVSKLGEWLSQQLIAIKTAMIWSSISIGVYFQTDDPRMLLFGIIIISHLFIAYHLMRDKSHFGLDRKGTVKYGKQTHDKIGLEFSLDTILSIFVLLNQTIFLLYFMAIAGAIPWIILFYQGIRKFLRDQ
jgi:phosphatidylglycerophosphate synthase